LLLELMEVSVASVALQLLLLLLVVVEVVEVEMEVVAAAWVESGRRSHRHVQLEAQMVHQVAQSRSRPSAV
jgi:hypothetical protein